MSNHEIAPLRPGRDLDLKVALEIMDYIWVTHWLRFSAEMAVKWIGTQQEIDEAGGVFTTVKPADFQELKHRENFDEAVPKYTTDITQSMKVIAKMTDIGFEYTLTEEILNDQIRYCAEFTKTGSQARFCAETKAEAITKAALLAILG
ncbi:hypothetical protein [Dendrosporobacter sp. 1207_IL3150]|uniref:hypothetical protein n=1 Tax=Dendrosporobacter sp. 1207_IL3150 TaxID=3084054 RepID=UPI002FDB145C